MFELNGHINSSVGKCANRIAWIRHGDRLVVVVADGAGNHADAGFAAEFAIKSAMKMVGRETRPLRADQWLNIVGEIDAPLSREPSGETSLVVADIGPEQVTGASVGDSKAFLAEGANLRDLTANQKRKPLLGSGEAAASAFETGWNGILLLCSDGLHKYAARDKLIAAVAGFDAATLIELARLPNGTLFDDAAALLVRYGKGATAPLPEGTIRYIDPA